MTNDKGDKLEKSKSKSHKKLTSPERNSFNQGKTNLNLKTTHTRLNDTNAPPSQKKSKSKSCEKLKV